MSDDQKDARDIAEDEYAGMLAAGMVPCDACDGYGIEWNEFAQCTACDGVGLVWPNLDEHGDSLASGDELMRKVA